MPLSDIPLSVLVILFLTIFVLIGLYPFIQKSMDSLSKFLEAADKSQQMFGSQIKDVHKELFTEHQTSSGSLNDFEIIVLRRIAQAGRKPLSRRQINEPLLFGDEILSKTLKSLYRRGYLNLRVSKFMGQRFILSDAGRRYALEQGYIVQLREHRGLI